MRGLGSDIRYLIFVSMPRSIEIIFTFLGLLLLSPLFIIISFMIKLDSKGPVYHKPSRVGQGSQLFKLFKFRTMQIDADQIGPPITTVNDSRITRIGKVLRKTKLDELPQLFNVLIGQMSLVGPRPEDPLIVKEYSEEQRKILNYKPGITSPASILFRSEEKMITAEKWEKEYLEEILTKKLEVDLNYMNSANYLSDLKVIFKTVLPRSKT